MSRRDGIILLICFTIFLYYVATISKTEENEDSGVKKYSNWTSALMIVGGLVGLTLGGRMFVDGAVSIATVLGMTERVIGLTVVAIGTSLPELVTSIVAARKGQNDIAVGNIVGSNIFNIFWILGLSATVAPITINQGNFTDIIVCTVTTILLFLALFIGQKNKLERWQGVAFIMLYSAYITYLIVS